MRVFCRARRSRIFAIERKAGWYCRAKMNPTPWRFKQSCRSSGASCSGMPRRSITSALPLRDVTLRFPCFTTSTPPAAKTNMIVVETLKEIETVPSRSTNVEHRTGKFRRVEHGIDCRSRSSSTKSAISSALSPFSCKRVRNDRFLLVTHLIGKKHRHREGDIPAVQVEARRDLFREQRCILTLMRSRRFSDCRHSR